MNPLKLNKFNITKPLAWACYNMQMPMNELNAWSNIQTYANE